MTNALANLERDLAAGKNPLAESFLKVASAPLKIAAVDDTVNESPEDARNRRLAELLKRRQPSGLTTGSASPTPPRDSS